MSGRAYQNDEDKVTWGKGLRTFVGMFLAPLDGLWGLAKWMWYGKTSEKYWYAGADITQLHSGKVEKGDQLGKTYSTAYAASRILTTLMFGLCIASILGALFAPIPGLAPAVAVGWLGIAKAAGITIGWCTLARGVGAAVGTIADVDTYEKVLELNLTFSQRLKHWMKGALKITLFGDALNHAVSLIRGFFKKSDKSEFNTKDANIEATRKKKEKVGKSSLHIATSLQNSNRAETDCSTAVEQSALSSNVSDVQFHFDNETEENAKPATEPASVTTFAIPRTSSPIREAVRGDDEEFSRSPSFNS